MPKGIYQHKLQQGFQKGVKHSKEHIDKIILALKGRKPTIKQLECLELGRGWMKGKHHSEETIKKIKKAKINNPTRYWLGKKNPFISGEKHPNWKGGLTEENIRLRHSEQYKNWQMEVYKRDHFICKDCDKHCGKDIVAHHLKDWSNFPELRFSIDNGITLCRSCHKKRHKEIGIKTRYIKAKKLLNWTPKVQIEEGIKEI